MFFAARSSICFQVANGWRTPLLNRVLQLNLSSLSQKAFDDADNDFIAAKAVFDHVLQKRRTRMEDLVKDLNPLKAFDMRLEQLLLEYPKWTSYGRDFYEKGDCEESYRIFIEDCDEEKIWHRLEDPRYNLSSQVDCAKVRNLEQLDGLTKDLTKLMLVFVDDDEEAGKRRRIEDEE